MASPMRSWLVIGAVVLALGLGVVVGLPRLRSTRALAQAREAMNSKDCAGVLEALDGVEGRGSDASFIHEARAFCHLQLEHWALAREEANAALQLDPKSQALDFRFVASRELGDLAAAEQDLGRLLELGCQSTTLRLQRATWRADRRDWDGVIEDCDAVLAKEPKHLEALNLRGHAWHALENWERAYLDSAAQAAIAPTVVGLRDAADLAIPLRRLDEADAHLAAALALDPNDVDALVLACRLGVVHFEADAGAPVVERGVKACERAAQVAPASSATHRRLGRLLREQGKLTEALAQASEATRLERGSSLAHRFHAEVLLALKRPQDSLLAIDTALSVAPDDTEVVASGIEPLLRQTKADVLVALRRYRDAREELEQALRLLPPDDEDVPAVRAKLDALPRP
jgi:tetratricopeptide (TPR) repeat protein